MTDIRTDIALRDLNINLGRLQEQIDNAHMKLDMLGVPRGRTSEQKLTILGRLDWLDEHVPQLAEMLAAGRALADSRQPSAAGDEKASSGNVS